MIQLLGERNDQKTKAVNHSDDVVLSGWAARRLSRRVPAGLDPRRSTAIKRNEHEWRVGAGARAFADAFGDVLVDPRSRFGAIRIKRLPANVGHPFRVGERFHGCFGLRSLLRPGLSRGWLRWLAPAVDAVLGHRRLRGVLTRLEDALLSDYAELEALTLDPDLERGEPFLFRYRYLSGAPLAGESAYLIEPLAEGRCRVRQIFTFQELGPFGITALHRFGIRQHDQVVAAQVRLAAERIGAPVLATTIRTTRGPEPKP